MSRFVMSALVLLAITLSCTVAWAQDEQPSEPTEPVKTFKLLRDDASAMDDLDLEDQEAEAWKPTLKPRAIQASLAIGFMNLSRTLLKHDQMIYKYNTDATYWGDVKLEGESAFAPALRLGYNVTDWISLEAWGGVSISEYAATVENRKSRKNEPGAPVVENPDLGDFDAETRSLITLQAGLNALWYPLDMGDASGRWHPFITGGVGNMWYNMNSNFTEGTVSAFDTNIGAGIRLIADRNISVRADVVMHFNKLDWTPADYFTELDEGTTRVPLNEYPVLPDGTIDERPVTDFEATNMSLLHWSLSIHGSF